MGRRVKNLHPKVAYALDRQLLELMRKGRRATDPATGCPLLDENGEPVFIAPTAADIQAARARLRDCGVQETEETDEIGQAIRRMQSQQKTEWGEPYPFPEAAADG